MNLCSDNHEEVCYESRNCPLCECIEENESLEQKIEVLEIEIASLED